MTRRVGRSLLGIQDTTSLQTNLDTLSTNIISIDKRKLETVVWNGSAWVNTLGAAYDTDPVKVRAFVSTNDAAATGGTKYNNHDIWMFATP